ncbi:MAG: hypothetical protein M3Y56_10920 [Armatimonadota bacterium]|nr:hypothetical protein [Armatimonadota bacterium]
MDEKQVNPYPAPPPTLNNPMATRWPGGPPLRMGLLTAAPSALKYKSGSVSNLSLSFKGPLYSPGGAAVNSGVPGKPGNLRKKRAVLKGLVHSSGPLFVIPAGF